MADRAHLEGLERRLNAEGRLIEAGWIGLRLAAIPADAPAVQLEEMRNAFFAGAHHLLHCIMRMLDGGDEATEQDLANMDAIQRELDTFIAEFERKHDLAKVRS